MSRNARYLGLYSVLLWAGACSVYSSSLVDGSAEPVTQGGSAAAGKSGGTAGKSGNTGGSSVAEPGGGGEGGEDQAGGAGNTSGSGGTDAAGTGNTAGSSTGGTGGSPSTGGGAGTSGTGGTMNWDAVVDGFEDKDLTLEQTDGRSGVWYTFHDTTAGKMTPSPLVVSSLTDAPAELGMYAMHITATGYTSYGSGLGVDFRAGKKLYDASAYTGIRFWAKVGDAAGTNTRHRMQISDIKTDPLGELCTPGAAAPEGKKCEDHYGANLVLTTEWKQFSFTFAQLSQLGWGYPADTKIKLDPTSLYGLQFTAKPDLEVDLWIDQVEFY